MTETYDPERPHPGEYLDYFEAYISLVGDGNILDILDEQIEYIRNTLDPLTAEQSNSVHEPYTWTIKQVVGHCVDTERIFGYRACRFAAADATPLPGFDQDVFVGNTDYENVSLVALTGELLTLAPRKPGHVPTPNARHLVCKGTGDGKIMTVRATAYILAGHINHHFDIIEGRLADV